MKSASSSSFFSGFSWRFSVAEDAQAHISTGSVTIPVEIMTMSSNRRGFLANMSALGAAPAVGSAPAPHSDALLERLSAALEVMEIVDSHEHITPEGVGNRRPRAGRRPWPIIRPPRGLHPPTLTLS